MTRQSRIIDADKILKKGGFKTPSSKVLRYQDEFRAGKEFFRRRFIQFGPLTSGVEPLGKREK